MILVTGGTGYIGSHVTLSLLASGFEVVVLDNLSNSSTESLERIKKITGRLPIFIKADICDKRALDATLKKYPISSALHLAGLKSIPESLQNPLKYLTTNVTGTINLCEVLAEKGIYKLIFSSSATVYGDPQSLPIRENCLLDHPQNPYGYSKLTAEHVLQYLSNSNPEWSIAILRYFNPIGAHESGLLGESSKSTPTNLVPQITQVAIGNYEKINIFGNDYPTKDGTAIRDYIHVMDLADGHIKALNKLHKYKGVKIWNLGTGCGYSVLEVIRKFELIAKKSIPYQILPRRDGDIAACWTDPSLAKKELDWSANQSLEKMLKDSWNWQLKNPNGFK